MDCRDFPPDKAHCTVSISADSEAELLEAAIHHGTTVHGYKDTPEFREQLRQSFKPDTPSA